MMKGSYLFYNFLYFFVYLVFSIFMDWDIRKHKLHTNPLHLIFQLSSPSPAPGLFYWIYVLIIWVGYHSYYNYCHPWDISFNRTRIFSYRLFSCGTSKEGESHLVEWNESEGAIKRTYIGFRKRSLGVVQFDTTRNRFLAAGDDFQIKFWDMDATNMLIAVDADGGLPVSLLLPFT